MAGLLLSHQAKVNIKDYKGNTPLHLCCFTGHLDPAYVLIGVHWINHCFNVTFCIVLRHNNWAISGLLFVSVKASLLARPFIWECVPPAGSVSCMQIKLSFFWNVLHENSYWNKGTRQIGKCQITHGEKGSWGSAFIERYLYIYQKRVHFYKSKVLNPLKRQHPSSQKLHIVKRHKRETTKPQDHSKG